ncbi:hypothetical protein E2C01_020681 [Portunus trituberculatus]|uniref:Uncharacterized protein n=1 Tax=Portunus trituberculatus TaxID=210409 RepID=A0A5B7E167_PORTR|nr:hypothetical protein [Portunus trituberculatus]
MKFRSADSPLMASPSCVGDGLVDIVNRRRHRAGPSAESPSKASEVISKFMRQHRMTSPRSAPPLHTDVSLIVETCLLLVACDLWLVYVEMAAFHTVSGGCVSSPILEAFVTKVSEVEAEFYRRISEVREEFRGQISDLQAEFCRMNSAPEGVAVPAVSLSSNETQGQEEWRAVSAGMEEEREKAGGNEVRVEGADDFSLPAGKIMVVGDSQVQPEVYRMTRVPPGTSPRNRGEFKPVLRCPRKGCQLHGLVGSDLFRARVQCTDVNASNYRWSEFRSKVCQMYDMGGEDETVEHVTLECEKSSRSKDQAPEPTRATCSLKIIMRFKLQVGRVFD